MLPKRAAVAVAQQIAGNLEDKRVDILDLLQRRGSEQPDKDILGQVLGFGPIAEPAFKISKKRTTKPGVKLPL
jgi:hypothetical protein